MFLESDNFIIDKLEIKDKDNLRILEESRSCAKTILAFYSEVIVVGAGADAVDYKLISICHKGDIVVSQDYGVAAMALGKGVYAIHQSGKWYIRTVLQNRKLVFYDHLLSLSRLSHIKNVIFSYGNSPTDEISRLHSPYLLQY